jgi:DNA-binding response OmpR family regulator
MSSKVLIVDDTVTLLDFLELIFEKQGFTVIKSADGEQAVELARERSPDVALVDVMMPGVDGLEVTRRLRADPSTARMPILLYSAVVGEEIRAQARAAGADEFLGKTLHHAELVELVREWLASRALPGGIGRSRLVEVALDLAEMLEVELVWLLGLEDQTLQHLAIASERGEQQARRFLQIVGRGPYPVDGETPFALAFASQQPSRHWTLESLRVFKGAHRLIVGAETLGLSGLELAVLNSPGGERGLLVLASPTTIAVDRKRASVMAVAIRYAGVALSQWGDLPSAIPPGDPSAG